MVTICYGSTCVYAYPRDLGIIISYRIYTKVMKQRLIDKGSTMDSNAQTIHALSGNQSISQQGKLMTSLESIQKERGHIEDEACSCHPFQKELCVHNTRIVLMIHHRFGDEAQIDRRDIADT